MKPFLCSVLLVLLSAGSSWAAIAHVQTQHGEGASSTTATTPAITTTTGNLVAISIIYDTTHTLSSVSDSKGNTWTQAWTNTDGIGNTVRQYYSILTSGGASHTFTVTLTGAGYPSLIVSEFSGINATPLDQSTSAQDTSGGSTHTSGTITTTNAIDVLIGTYATGSTTTTITPTGTGTWTTPSNWVSGNTGDCGGGGVNCVSQAYQIISSTGTSSYDVTSSNTPAGAVIGITSYKASGGGGGPTGQRTGLMMMGVGM